MNAMCSFFGDMIILIICTFMLDASASDSAKEMRYGTRIANGVKVLEGQFPSMVAIFKYDTQSFCGGAIISQKFVVTAAHCVDDQGSYYILAGTTNLDKGGIRKKIEKITLHPEYVLGSDYIRYDIAVVELESALPPFSGMIRAVELPEFSTEIPHEYGTVLGWGVNENGEMPEENDLMRVELIEEECNVEDDLFCLGHPEGNKDSCTGDSGGPFIINRTLYGIVSYSLGPCAKGSPGVYVKVPYLVEWIRKVARM